MDRTSVARALALLLAMAPLPLAAQARNDTAAVRAVIDSSLAAVSRTDFAALSEYMLPEAILFAVQHRDSVDRYSASTRTVVRDSKFTVKFAERGFAHEIRVAGPLAMAWVPYDFYRDGAWSHCGIDTFTLMRINGRWMIATLAYTVAQPPACRKHPDGPPK